MGDFASPAAGANGSICINNSLNNSVVAPGIPKHSTVVERLRQRIEGCRRHHVTCETRYQQAHAEQLEIERRETVSLYQRSLEQRAKKSAPGSTKQPQSKQLEADSAVSTEQRNNTLIAPATGMHLEERLARRTGSNGFRSALEPVCLRLCLFSHHSRSVLPDPRFVHFLVLHCPPPPPPSIPLCPPAFPMLSLAVLFLRLSALPFSPLLTLLCFSGTTEKDKEIF